MLCTNTNSVVKNGTHLSSHSSCWAEVWVGLSGVSSSESHWAAAGAVCHQVVWQNLYFWGYEADTSVSYAHKFIILEEMDQFKKQTETSKASPK